MATIKDVAQMAGVSPSTVSKFLNGGHVLEDKAQAISHAVEHLKYRVNPYARQLKKQKSGAIGVLLPDMTAPFYGTVVMTLDKVLREHGYHSLISCYGANHGLERGNLQFLLDNGIDGLIYAPEDLTAEEYREILGQRSLPAVQIDRLIPGVEGDGVLVDNTSAVREAVFHLAAKGHQRIAIIMGPKSVLTAKERLVGYLRALSDLGLMYYDELVISGQNEFATGYYGFEQLMSLPEPPTAVFTTNYNITMGLVTAARERGVLIPDELDIFGFDSKEICTMLKPPIPVVCQPEQEIGRIAAEYMIQRLEGYEGENRIIRLPCHLAFR